jgi:hypothetical protein
MRSDSHRPTHPVRRLELVSITESNQCVPLWCRSRATPWQARMRTHVVADGTPDTPRWPRAAKLHI